MRGVGVEEGDGGRFIFGGEEEGEGGGEAEHASADNED